MKDDVKTLAYDDILPLQWVELPALPDALRLERLSETNVGVLARVATIEERHRMVGEDGELEQEINRLHSKMDLLLGLVASIARQHLKLPDAVEIRLSAYSLRWKSVAPMPPAGSRIMISLYLNPCIAEPLSLPAVIQEGEGEWVEARFEHLGATCHSTLEQHVFLHHRRSIAETRILEKTQR
ncbi:MAG: hypothetical protein E6Q40_01880 [Cupriavidus sp.]|nr:MAG: hypothetical protein E6Q40_01880 [Cupriavidus sp.]